MEIRTAWAATKSIQNRQLCKITKRFLIQCQVDNQVDVVKGVMACDVRLHTCCELAVGTMCRPQN
eukprot:899386-Rhodomonas_salina.1